MAERVHMLVRALLLLALCAVGALGREQLDVLLPMNVVHRFNRSLPEQPALFGIPPFGASVTGKLIYAYPRDGCLPFDTKRSNPLWPPFSDTEPQIVIAVVDRGGCNFVPKVRNAELAGANAVVVVDDRNEVRMPFMRDDGTGGNIQIPSVMIFKNDGDILKQYLLANTSILASISWPVPQSSHVDWELWSSADDAYSAQFKSAIAPAIKALGSSATVVPHVLLDSGDYNGCHNQNQTCGSLCTNYGRYCVVAPQLPLATVPGRSVIRENLRQLCLFHLLNDTGSTLPWWEYVTLFQQHCASSLPSWTDFCANSVLTLMGIDHVPVDSCMTNSGDVDRDTINTFLQAELNKRYSESIFIMPTVVVNNQQYHLTLDCPSPLSVDTCGVLRIICSTFTDDTLPAACASTDCPLGSVKDRCGVCDGKNACESSGGLSIGTVILIVCSALAIVGLLGYLYIRYQRNKMRMDLHNILQSYMPLEEANKHAGFAKSRQADQTQADRAQASKELDEDDELLLT